MLISPNANTPFTSKPLYKYREFSAENRAYVEHMLIP